MAAADRTKGSARSVRTSVWLEPRPAPKRTSGRPAAGLDRDRIVAATVGLLDEQGLAEFSMRRLAARLGVTAMSVYWYVDTKDDLLELALDRVYGELALPGPDEGDWRGGMRALATGFRKLLVAHPWLSRLVGEYLNIGPHALAFSRASRRVLRQSGLPEEKLPGGLLAVFQFVYGFGTVEGRLGVRCAAAGISEDAYMHRVLAALRESEEYQEVYDESRELMAARGGDTVEEMRQRDFGTALDILVAGIEAMRAAPGGGAPGAG